MRINLVVNLAREDAISAACEAADWLRARGVEVGAEEELSKVIPIQTLPVEELGDADLVVAIGGDGTLIRAAHICSVRGTPVLGVYYGRFGFVTKCDPEELFPTLEVFLSGNAKIEERMMIQTELIRGDKPVATLHCLNEAVLHRDATGRVLTFSVTVDGEFLTSYPADGVLLVTPTGSTAYNLSAGGPIVDPGLKAMILTPINAHTLTVRPLVLQSNSCVELSVSNDGDAVLLCDGQHRLHLLSGDVVRITSSDRITRLVKVKEMDFLVKLRDRIF